MVYISMVGIVCQIGSSQPIILNLLNFIFKKRFDQYWQHQDITYNFREQIQGTGNRGVLRVLYLVKFWG